jgi:hypothetical protein
MAQLVIQTNYLSYSAAFLTPRWSLLLDDQSRVVEALYESFSEKGTAPTDISLEGDADRPASESVAATIPNVGVFSVKNDGVQFAAQGITDAGLESLPDILRRGTEWLRVDAGKGRLFESHTVNYIAHGGIPGSNSTEVLQRLPQRALGFESSMPSGIIAHGRVQDLGAEASVHLTVDHSAHIRDGLYVQLIVHLIADQVNYSKLLSSTRSILDKGLASLDLTLPIAAQ